MSSLSSVMEIDVTLLVELRETKNTSNELYSIVPFPKNIILITHTSLGLTLCITTMNEVCLYS